jgi:DNA-binding transcriptional LysR family regulator
VDIKQTELGLLLALHALLDHENVSLAAKQIGITQPAMSAQLKRLRDLFNDPLLVPSGRRLVATTRARALQNDLHAHLQGLNALVRNHTVFDPVSSETTFRLIGTDYVHAVLAAPLQKLLAAEAPGARAAFLAFDPKTLWSSLEAETADLALATGMSLPEAKRQSALTEDFQVIMSKTHPLVGQPMTLEGFCAFPHILVSPEGGGFIGATDRVLKETGHKRRVAISLPSFLLAPALVSSSDALCMMPSRLAKLHEANVACSRSPFPSPVFDVDLMWHPRRQNDPAHKWFRGQIRRLAQGL